MIDAKYNFFQNKIDILSKNLIECQQSGQKTNQALNELTSSAEEHMYLNISQADKADLDSILVEIEHGIKLGNQRVNDYLRELGTLDSEVLLYFKYEKINIGNEINYQLKLTNYEEKIRRQINSLNTQLGQAMNHYLGLKSLLEEYKRFVGIHLEEKLKLKEVVKQVLEENLDNKITTYGKKHSEINSDLELVKSNMSTHLVSLNSLEELVNLIKNTANVLQENYNVLKSNTESSLNNLEERMKNMEKNLINTNNIYGDKISELATIVKSNLV